MCSSDLTYSKLGDGEKAELYCKKILEIDPFYSPALNRLAWVYARDNRSLDEAEKQSLASMKYNQDLPEYLDTLSEVYYKKKEFKKAVEQMRRALDARPNNRYFQSQMRKILAALKRFNPKTYAEIKQKKDAQPKVTDPAKQASAADALEKKKLRAERKEEAKMKAIAKKIAEREAALEAAQAQAGSKPKKVQNKTATAGGDGAPAVDTKRTGQQVR